MYSSSTFDDFSFPQCSMLASYWFWTALSSGRSRGNGNLTVSGGFESALPVWPVPRRGCAEPEGLNLLPRLPLTTDFSSAGGPRFPFFPTPPKDTVSLVSLRLTIRPLCLYFVQLEVNRGRPDSVAKISSRFGVNFSRKSIGGRGTHLLCFGGQKGQLDVEGASWLSLWL